MVCSVFAFQMWKAGLGDTWPVMQGTEQTPKGIESHTPTHTLVISRFRQWGVVFCLSNGCVVMAMGVGDCFLVCMCRLWSLSWWIVCRECAAERRGMYGVMD